MKYNIYLFDFDYTLADSSRGIVTCFRNVLTRNGFTTMTDDDIKRTIGKTLEDSFSILTGVTDPETLEGFRKEYVKEADVHMTVNTFLFPETKAVLVTLKKRGARIGIISTKYRYRIKELLDQHFPPKFFDVIIGGEDVKRAKPSPQGIKKALRRLHGKKKEVLYIGDSTVDAETAQAARVDFVGVLHGMTTRKELAVYPHRQILEDLTLLPLVNEISPYKACKYLPHKLVAYYKLLHQKQIRGVQQPSKSETSHTCKNCKTKYAGNYCPNCSQTYNTPRFTIRNAFQNILSGFFNIDNGFSRNLLELLYRPGYMIRDYLSGKRVHYFKPFQTLFVLAALYIMAVQLIDPTALKKEEEKEELTYESIMSNLKSKQKEASYDSTLFYLDQSLAYTDKARISESQPRPELKMDSQFENLISDEIEKQVQKKVLKTGGNPGNVTELVNEIIDSLTYADSAKITSMGTDEQSELKAQIRQGLKKNLSKQESKSDGEDDFASEMVDAGRTVGKEWDKFMNEKLGENKFFSSVYNLMTNWVHGNKAFSILALLPIFALSTRWSFRKSIVGYNFNLTEQFFAQVYIACQILWLSLLVLPFTREAHLNDIFDLNSKVIFFLFVWDYRQLFNISWMKSLWRTIVMFWYCILIMLLICIVIIGALYLFISLYPGVRT